MKELVFDPKKAKAQERLKTDEEIITDQKEMLERLEELRQKRMKGEDIEENEQDEHDEQNEESEGENEQEEEEDEQSEDDQFSGNSFKDEISVEEFFKPKLLMDFEFKRLLGSTRFVGTS